MAGKGKLHDIHHKRCVQCKQVKPIRMFDLPRHRLCTACRLHTDDASLLAYVTGEVPASALWPATTTAAGHNRYQRERYRAAALQRDPLTRQLDHTAVPKLCRTCHMMKPASHFANPRWRVCLSCEGRA
jgi:hypothetical protein